MEPSSSPLVSSDQWAARSHQPIDETPWLGSRVATERLTIQPMEHVGIVVDDVAAATALFVEIGLTLQGEGPVEGR